MKFYYSRVERIGKEEEEREKELDGALRGNVLHHVLAVIYEPLQQKPHSEVVEGLHRWTDDVIEQTVSQELLLLL
ncbi:MAG: hypothetical protein RR550_00760, partial [Rikenellaceae bacterium]